MKLLFFVAILLIFTGGLLEFFPAFNQSLFVALNSLLPVAVFWTIVTTLGDGAVAGCLFYLLFRKRNDLLAKGLIGGVAALLTAQGLKKIFAVSRPEHTVGFEDNFYLLTESMTATNFSMPSGHTITAFLLGSLLIRYLKLSVIGRALLVVVLISIAVSRVALGVHWPADVFVGAGLGIFIAIICVKLPVDINARSGVMAVHILYLPFVAALIHKYFL